MPPPPRAAGRRSRSAQILQNGPESREDYLSFDWLLLWSTMFVVFLIFALFTPYTNQLDEIKNLLLMTLPPVLLVLALLRWDFSRMNFRDYKGLVYLAAFLLSIVVSWIINPQKAIGERVIWFQIGVATFTFLFATLLNSENKLRKTMIFFVLLSLFSCVFGLFIFAGQGFIGHIFNWMVKRDYFQTNQDWLILVYTLQQSKEMYSTILNPDFYAAYLVMTIPIVLSMFFVEERLLLKAVSLLTFLLMNVCLGFTLSNDSFLSIVFVTYPVYFILGYLYVFDWRLSKRTLAIFFAGSAVLALTLGFLLSPMLYQFWEFKTQAIDGRKILWMGGVYPWLYGDDGTRSAINPISFLFGTGPGGYRHYFPVFRDPTFFDNQINNVTTFSHNYYIDVLCEFGLLGFVCFAAMYGVVLWNAYQQVRTSTSRPHQYYQLAMVAALSGIALQNFFSPNNRWAVAGMVFWSLFGISMGIWYLEKGLNTQDDGKRRGTAPASAANWHYIQYALLAIAVLFCIRSIPQGIRHFEGAKRNSFGLQKMEQQPARLTPAERAQWDNDAIKAFQDAIDLNPTFVTSYYKVAHMYFSRGELDRAIETYQTLEKFNPHYSEIHLNLGIVYSTKASRLTGRERIEALQKAYASIKEGARQSLKPVVQRLAGDIGQELAIALRQEKLEPEDVRALFGDNLETTDIQRVRNAKFIEVLEELKPYYRSIIDYKPRLPGEIAGREQNLEDAYLNLVQLGLLTRKPDEAIAVRRELYTYDPTDVDNIAALLDLYEELDRVDERIEFLEMAAKGDPLDYRLRQLLAAAYLEADRMDDFARELRRIEVLRPELPGALAGLYVHYMGTGDAARRDEYRAKLAKIGIDTEQLTESLKKATADRPDAVAQLLIDSVEDTTAPRPAPAPAPADAVTTGAAE